MGRGSLIKLVKAHGNTKLVKGPRKPEVSKWAKDAQGKKGHKSPSVRKPMVYTAGPKGPSRIKSL